MCPSPDRLWLTQSILGDWLYCAGADDREELIRRIMRLKREQTTAMRRGLDFEARVTAWASGNPPDPNLTPAELSAVRKFGNLCRGGAAQAPITGVIRAGGLEFQAYGICDFVKAGRIFDIKRVSRYEYGKYQFSPQHPMYLALLPEATRFDYLVFDGQRWYIETYRRGDFPPVEETVSEFVRYLRDTGTLDTYIKNWSMTSQRQDLIYGIYQRKK